MLLSSAVVIALRDKTVYQSITAACLFVSTTRSSIHTHTHTHSQQVKRRQFFFFLRAPIRFSSFFIFEMLVKFDDFWHKKKMTLRHRVFFFLFFFFIFVFVFSFFIFVFEKQAEQLLKTFEFAFENTKDRRVIFFFVYCTDFR